MTRIAASDHPVTIRDVAGRAGVAISSVSRVLNGSPGVSPAMRERVLTAVKQLEYEPDLVASALRRGATMTIGMVISDISNPLYADIFRGAERLLRENGFSMILAQSEGDPSHDVRSIRVIRQRKVDGILVSIADESNPATRSELQRLDIPAVLLDRDLDVCPTASAVLTDHRAGMRTTCEYLLRSGHRDIAYVGAKPTTRPARERLLAFSDELDSAADARPVTLIGDGGFEFGRLATEKLFGSPTPPSAVIVGGNLTFVGVVDALKRLAIAIGDDATLVTCDDVPLARYHTPAVSVITRDTMGMGRLAAQLLLERLSGEPSRTVHMATDFVLRESALGVHWRSPHS